MEFYQKQTLYASARSQKSTIGLRKKILVVDDDQSICEAIKLILTDEGYTVHIIRDTSKLYDLESNDVDLILMDVWMDNEDGREICRYLKKNSQTKDIPIILFSASRDIGWSAMKAGANDFMEKPFSMDELLSRVSNQLD